MFATAIEKSDWMYEELILLREKLIVAKIFQYIIIDFFFFFPKQKRIESDQHGNLTWALP